MIKPGEKIIYNQDGVVITEKEFVGSLPVFMCGPRKTEKELEEFVEFMEKHFIKRKRQEAGLDKT